jgi:putative ABC transport system substrate-binding protein
MRESCTSGSVRGARGNSRPYRDLRRREFITLFGGAAAWPLAARAQQRVMPVIGYLHSGLPGQDAEQVAGFLKGLGETGFVEGRNVAIEHRWAENQYDRFPALAADLVGRGVAVIFTTPPQMAAAAAKAATTTIPIVFNTGADPVRTGLVASFNHPGGNLTGVLNISGEIGSKRLGLLNELVPTVTTIAVLNNQNLDSRLQIADMEAAARRLGKKLLILNAGTVSDLDQAFAAAAAQKAGAAVAISSVFFGQQRVRLVVLAAHHTIPTMGLTREFPAAGGLVSYGPSAPETSRQCGLYVGRILKGEKAADLPVMQPTKFELVINVGTAKTLGLTIPPGVLAIADEVIE